MKKYIASVLGVIILVVLYFFSYPLLENIKMETKPQPHAPNPDLKIRASIPYWDQDNAVSSFKANVDKIDQVTLFWYYLTEDGKIQKYKSAKEDLELIKFAKESNVKVSVLISNLPEDGDWDSERVEKVLENPQLTSQHILDIQKKLTDLNADGITIDYEQVDSSQKDKFSKFITDLNSALDQSDKFVGVSLHPKKDSVSDKQYAFQDWKKLGQSADEFYIMSFGEHWDEGEAGPIASVSWSNQILKYANLQGLPAEKIYLGIGLFGYDWNHDSDDSATGLTYKDVVNLKSKYSLSEKWDEKSGAPYFKYQEDGDEHEVWFENGKSVLEKINLAKQSGLAGVSFWRLGGEDPEIWKNL